MMPGRPIPGLCWLLWAMLGLIGSFPCHAQQPSDAVETLFAAPSPAAAGEPSNAAAPAVDRTPEPAIAEMLKRLDAIEARLGHSVRPPSVSYNLERRLAELEKRVQQIEQQLTRTQQMDQRIRRLEMKQP